MGPARKHLSMLPLYAIVMSIQEAETYFWSCSGFSIWFVRLVTADGERFRNKVREAGKGLCTWTVNEEWEMRECVRMGLDSVITDKPDVYVDMVKKVSVWGWGWGDWGYRRLCGMLTSPFHVPVSSRRTSRKTWLGIP